jgi:hypothetical protein
LVEGDGGWVAEFMEDCASRIRGRVQIGLLRVCFQSYHRNKKGPSENGPKLISKHLGVAVSRNEVLRSPDGLPIQRAICGTV